MTDIRFKVWDRQAKKMRTWEQIKQYPMYHLNDEDVVHLMFTGLKDKNGVEIFDGDIVRPAGQLDDDEAEVKFSGGAFVAHHRAGDARYDDYAQLGLGEWKVIGNIYENPELMDHAA